MTHYATRGAVLDRFLAERDVDPDSVLSVDLARYTESGDIRVHTVDRILGLTYTPEEKYPGHSSASIDREDLTILAVHYDPKAVTA